MRNLLRFIIQYHVLILFVLIEVFSITLLVGTGSYQEARFYQAGQRLQNTWSYKVENIRDYLSLYQENKRLVEENNRLYNLLRSSYKVSYIDSTFRGDTLNQRYYQYITASVINNSVNKKYNYITLDKGGKHGIEPEMAVICDEGIVGMVITVSDNFCVVLSLLNPRFGVSAKIKSSGFFGPLSWKETSSDKAILEDIPHHAEIVVGDTVLTSGYGSTFPENIVIGVISKYKLKGGNYYEITVQLATDFQRLDHVQVIRNEFRKETVILEETAAHE
ncbi:MAG: rod shape-determining protein MreC [Bacteroidales bacterium]|nr:rod shape-determining protein MreC [Bacteroidales bacterium]